MAARYETALLNSGPETVENRKRGISSHLARRLTLSLALAFSQLSLPGAADATSCQFQLGFKTLHDAIPDQVGNCLDNESHNPKNGDGLEHTTDQNNQGGLLVWRKADNWTAYTDGYRTWVNGPFGLQERLNTERFPWEADNGTAQTIIADSQNGMIVDPANADNTVSSSLSQTVLPSSSADVTPVVLPAALPAISPTFTPSPTSTPEPTPTFTPTKTQPTFTPTISTYQGYNIIGGATNAQKDILVQILNTLKSNDSSTLILPINSQDSLLNSGVISLRQQYASNLNQWESSSKEPISQIISETTYNFIQASDPPSSGGVTFFIPGSKIDYIRIGSFFASSPGVSDVRQALLRTSWIDKEERGIQGDMASPGQPHDFLEKVTAGESSVDMEKITSDQVIWQTMDLILKLGAS